LGTEQTFEKAVRNWHDGSRGRPWIEWTDNNIWNLCCFCIL